jgi:OOP family OmpA-OmpF porin
MNNAKIFFPCALWMLSGAALAGDVAGPYVVAEVSHSQTSLGRGHFDEALTTAGATGIDSRDSGDGNQWRLQGGYRFNPNVAVEAGYIDLGKAKYRAGFTGGAAKGDLKAGGLDAVVLLGMPLSDKFSIAGKAGIIAAHVKSELSAGGVAVDGHASTNVVRPLLGVSMHYQLAPQVDLRADVDRVANIGTSGHTGKMDSNMVSLGIAYHF